jgi:putative phosphoribosyl transferase
VRVDEAFSDRFVAGTMLAARLGEYASRSNVRVLALPRGGVPVGYEVAIALHAPLDVFVVRKLGVPGHEELAFGAVATGGERVLSGGVIASFGITPEIVERVTTSERHELERRERAYRGDARALDIQGCIVILVDDGLATGATMRVAVRAVRADRPARIVVAVPVASTEACRELSREGDEVVAVSTPEPFIAVGVWYRDFSETTDDTVRALIARARSRATVGPGT